MSLSFQKMRGLSCQKSTCRDQSLKSKAEEPPKLSTSSGTRRGKIMSVNNFSAQEHTSSKNRHILNFRVRAVRDIKL